MGGWQGGGGVAVAKGSGEAYRVVLMLSVGVTANSDSVTPAPKPAMTVRGPESLPFSSTRRALYWSNATKPAHAC